MSRTLRAAIASFVFPLLSWVANNHANAAEIRFLHPGVLTGFVNVVVPQFEKSTGHKVTTAADSGGALTERIQMGEAADVLIVTAGQIKQLAAQGKVVAGRRPTSRGSRWGSRCQRVRPSRMSARSRL
jgi:molybdate transport system substrate-binding protein